MHSPSGHWRAEAGIGLCTDNFLSGRKFTLNGYTGIQPDNPFFLIMPTFFHGIPVHEIAVALPATIEDTPVVLADGVTGYYKNSKFKLEHGKY